MSSENIPPTPTSVPPKRDDTADGEAAGSVDAASWGASGKDPREAMREVPDNLRKEGRVVVDKLKDVHRSVKRFAGNVKDDLAAGKKAESRPAPLNLTEPEPPVEVPAEETPAPVEEERTPITPSTKGYSGYRALVLTEDEPWTEAAPADPAEVVRSADSETLKQAMAFEMLKPAERKRALKEMLRNNVSQLAAEVGANGIEKAPGFSYKQFVDMAGPAREAAKEEYARLKYADERYADTYKTFFYNNNILERVWKRGFKSQAPEVARAKAERDEKRIEAKRAFEKAARERWEQQGKSPEWIERALGKYENLHLFKDIIAPGVDQDIKMRAEALGEKAPDMLDKGIKWFNRANERLDNFFMERFGQKHARWVRAVGSAVLVSGGAAFIGSFGTAGVLAAAGFASFNIMRSLGATAIGLTAAEAVGFAYRKLRGEKEQAKAVQSEEELRQELRRLSQNKDLTLEVLQAIERKRLALKGRADSQTLENKVNAIKALVGLGVGVGASAALAEYHGTADVMRAADEINSAGGAPSVDGVETAAVDVPADSEGAGPAGLSSVMTDGEASVAPLESGIDAARSLSIAGNINNADRLVGHFGLQLSEAYPNLSEAPPSVQSFIDLLRTEEGASLLAGEDKATLAFNLQLDDGTSAIMQPGDVIRLDDANQIVLERPGTNLSAVLVGSDGTINTNLDQSWPMEGNRVEVPRAPAPEVPQQPETVPVQPEVPSQPEVPQQPEAAPSAPAPIAPEAPPAPTAPEAPQPQYAPPVPEMPSAPEAPSVPESRPMPEVPQQSEYAPPAPEAPAQTEAPQPQAPEGPIDYTQPYTNINGIDIDPRQPAVFIDSRGDVVAYGGTTIERTALAQQYALEHPGVRVLFDATTESIYGIPQPIIGAMVSNAEGQITPYSGILHPDYFQGLSIPHPNDLVRSVPFTPRQ